MAVVVVGLKMSALVVVVSSLKGAVHTIWYVLSTWSYLPRQIVFALKKHAFLRFVGHELVEGCCKFVGQRFAKGAKKGQKRVIGQVMVKKETKNACWSRDGQERKKGVF